MTSVSLSMLAVHTSERHTFVSLSKQAAQTLLQSSGAMLGQGPIALLVEHDHKRSYVGFAGTFTEADGIRLSMGIPSALAASLGIDTHSIIRVSVVTHSSPTSALTVEPLTYDDWEILSLNASYLEMHLLEQVQIIDLNASSFPFYVNESQLIHLKVTDCSNANQGHARLILTSQLIVAPKVRKTNQINSNAIQPSDQPDQPAPRRYKLRVQPRSVQSKIESAATHVFVNAITLHHMHLEANQLVVIKSKRQSVNKPINQSNNQSINQQTSQTLITTVIARIATDSSVADRHIVLSSALQRQLAVSTFCRVTVSAVHPTTATLEQKSIQSLVLRPCVNQPTNQPLEPVYQKEVAHAFLLFINKQSKLYSSLPVVSTALIEFPFKGQSMMCQLLINETSRQTSAQPQKRPPHQHQPAASPNGVQHQHSSRSSPFTQQSAIRMKVVQPAHYYLLSDPQPLSLTANSKLPPLPLPLPQVRDPICLPPFVPSMPLPSHVLSGLGGLTETVVKPTLNHIRSLLTPPYSTGAAGLMIVGETGTSKSVTVRAIAYELYTRHRIHVTIIDGRQWQDEKRQRIQHNLAQAIRTARACAPSLIVIDDMDAFLPAASEQDHAAHTQQTNAIASYFNDLILMNRANTGPSEPPVAFLITASSVSATHPVLASSLLFPTIIAMPSLGLRERAQVLNVVLKRLHAVEAESTVCSRVSELLEGYRARDIEQVVSRAIHSRMLQHQGSDKNDRSVDGAAQSGSVQLSFADFKRALVGFTPSALKDLPPAAPAVVWEDIGGLKEVKTVLKETLELPTAYAPLFDRIPIKLRSGCLLYGPPGCGKTALALAITDHCHLPLISVKGPELLNKYIGSSEAAVRAVFERARACAPCVLFFDELESIATKRGSENTGVTDRVVNQFLCELDGVEGGATQQGKGRVFILAASSRPDLIDPALLRPGRIDKSLYCPWPEREDRKEILTLAVTKLNQILMSSASEEEVDPEAEPVKYPLDPSILETIERIADRTDGYSGADMRAIATNAQIELIHSQMKESDNDIEQQDVVAEQSPLPPLDATILWSAFEQSNASISTSDRHFYSRVYAKYIASKEGHPDNSFDPNAKQKLMQA